MRNFLIALVVLCNLLNHSTASAQENEVIVWARGTTLIPWYFHTGDKVSAEVRYGLDQDKTATICLGVPIGSDAFSLIPEGCIYMGQETGYGPELWVLSETKHFSLTSYIQHATFQEKETKPFTYAWLQAEVKMFKHFHLGVGGQVLKEGNLPAEVDVGASAKLVFGRITLNALPLWRVTPLDKGKLTFQGGIIYSF